MPVKPPSFNYGGGGSALGLIAQAMGNKYRSTPTQQLGQQMILQGQRQAFQRAESERARQQRVLDDLRAMQFGIQQGIAQNQYLTEATAREDPALAGRLGDIDRVQVSLLNLPGMDILTEEQLASLGPTSYEFLNRGQAANIQRTYVPFREGEVVPEGELSGYQLDWLAQHPQMADTYVAADPGRVDLVLNSLMKAGYTDDVNALRQALVDENGAQIPISQSDLQNYAERYDFRRAEEQFVLQQREIEAREAGVSQGWEDLRRLKEQKIEEFRTLVPEGTTMDELQEDYSSAQVVPYPVARAIYDITERAARARTPAELDEFIAAQQQQLGPENQEWNLADLYYNWTPAPIERMSLAQGTGRPTGGRGTLTYEPLPVQALEEKEDWLTGAVGGGTTFNWLEKQILPLAKEDEEVYAAMRELYPGLPENPNDIDDVTQFVRYLETDGAGELTSLLMTMMGSVTGYNNPVELAGSIARGLNYPGEDFQYVPTERWLRSYYRLLKATGNDRGWTGDPEGFFNEMIDISRRAYRTPGIATGEATEEAMGELRTGLREAISNRIDYLNMNLTGRDSLLAAVTSDFRPAMRKMWVNPDPEEVAEWYDEETMAYNIARVGLSLRGWEGAEGKAAREKYEEIIGKLAEAGGAPAEDVIALVNEMLEVLPTENSGAAEIFSRSFQDIVNAYNTTGLTDDFDTFINAFQVAIWMLDNNQGNPRVAWQRYDVRQYGGLTPRDSVDTTRLREIARHPTRVERVY